MDTWDLFLPARLHIGLREHVQDAICEIPDSHIDTQDSRSWGRRWCYSADFRGQSGGEDRLCAAGKEAAFCAEGFEVAK